MNTKMSLKEWMDRKDLSIQEIAKKLDISEQTLRHWRSSGVPERRQQHVELFMTQWDVREANPATSEDLNIVRLKISDEKFETWSEAAHRSNKALIPWIIDELDNLAAQEGLLDNSKTPPNMYEPEPEPTVTPTARSVSRRANGKGAA